MKNSGSLYKVFTEYVSKSVKKDLFYFQPLRTLLVDISFHNLRVIKSVNKPYKEQETLVPNVAEPVVVCAGNENNPDIVAEGCDDIRRAISGEELLARLTPRIKALFE